MSSLPYVVCLDDSLILGNAQGQITISASQQTQQSYAANSQSLSQIQFQNIKLSGSNSLFDSQAYCEYSVTIQADLKYGTLLPGLLFTQGSTIANITIAPDNGTYPILTSNSAGTGWSTNIGNLCFRQLPLSRNTQSLLIALNNANGQTYNLQQQLALNDVLTEDAKLKLSGYCAVDNQRGVVIPNWYTLSVPATHASTDQLTLTVDENYKGAGGFQPNDPYWAGGRNFIKVVSVSANNAGVYSATYRIREPILGDPFTVAYSGPALCNLNSISITYSLDSSNLLKGMFCATKNYFDQGTTEPTDTNLQVLSITNANLLMRTYSVDNSVVNIPQTMYYDYNGYMFNQTLAPNSIAGDQTKQTTAMNLDTVPLYYIAKIMPLPNGMSAVSQQCGASIRQITVQYGAMGRYVFSDTDLYEAYKRNAKVQISFNQWLQDCIVMLNPALDLVNSASSFTGIANSGTLSFSVSYTYNCNNLVETGIPAVATDLYIQEMFCFAGSIAVGSGVAVYTQTTINSSQLVSALDKPLISHKALRNAHGIGSVRSGSLFSSIGNVLRGAVSALPGVINTAANVVNHPVVQSALGALGGAGGQLMYSSRRGRR